MKKFLLFLLVALILGSQSIFGQEIDHEKVLTDGYQKVTKGAYWSKRPESKMVYEGETPDGVEVIILPSNHFVRFAKGEHNPLDINYIVFPAGEKIYKKGGNYFAAICGNKIETWRPVEKERIVEKIKTVTQQSSVSDSTKKAGTKRPLEFGGNKTKPKLGNLNPNKNTSNSDQKGEFKVTVGGVVVTICVVALLVKLATILFPGHHDIVVINNNGNPGGAQTTPGTGNTTVPPPTGGPGGAPTTK